MLNFRPTVVALLALALFLVAAPLSIAQENQPLVQLLTQDLGDPASPKNFKLAIHLPRYLRRAMGIQTAENFRVYVFPPVEPEADAMADPANRAKGIMVWQGGDTTYLDVRLPPVKKSSGRYTVLVQVAHNGRLVAQGRAKEMVRYQPGTVDVVLVIDSSLSMLRSDRKKRRLDAAHAFVDLAARDGRIRSVGIVAFNDTSRILAPLTPLTQRATLDKAIDSIGAQGQTNMDRALEYAGDLLAEGKSDRGAVVFLTDGRNEPRPYNGEHRRLAAWGLPIYAIGLSEKADHALLQRMASETGGRHFQASRDQDLMAIYMRIASELGRQEVLLTRALDGHEMKKRFGIPLDDTLRSASFLMDQGDEEIAISLNRVKDGTTTDADDVLQRYGGAGYQAFRIADPKPGVWILDMARKQSGDPVACTVTADTRLYLDAFPLHREGRRLHLAATIASAGKPLSGGRVRVLSYKEAGLDGFDLFDDGAHGDGTAHDGVFAGYYDVPPTMNSSIVFRLRAWGVTPGKFDYVRQTEVAVSHLEALPPAAPAGPSAQIEIAHIGSLDLGAALAGDAVEGHADIRLRSPTELAVASHFSGFVSHIGEKISPAGCEVTPGNGTLLAAGTHRLSFRFQVPKGVTPGSYKGMLRLFAGGRETSVPVQLDVPRVRIRFTGAVRDFGVVRQGSESRVNIGVELVAPRDLPLRWSVTGRGQEAISLERSQNLFVAPGEKTQLPLLLAVPDTLGPGRYECRLSVDCGYAMAHLPVHFVVPSVQEHGAAAEILVLSHEVRPDEELIARYTRVHTPDLPPVVPETADANDTPPATQPVRPEPTPPPLAGPAIPTVTPKTSEQPLPDEIKEEEPPTVATIEPPEEVVASSVRREIPWQTLLLFAFLAALVATVALILRRIVSSRMLRFALLSLAVHLPLLLLIGGYFLATSISPRDAGGHRIQARLVGVSSNNSATTVTLAPTPSQSQPVREPQPIELQMRPVMPAAPSAPVASHRPTPTRMQPSAFTMTQPQTPQLTRQVNPMQRQQNRKDVRTQESPTRAPAAPVAAGQLSQTQQEVAAQSSAAAVSRPAAVRDTAAISEPQPATAISRSERPAPHAMTRLAMKSPVRQPETMMYRGMAQRRKESPVAQPHRPVPMRGASAVSLPMASQAVPAPERIVPAAVEDVSPMMAASGAAPQIARPDRSLPATTVSLADTSALVDPPATSTPTIPQSPSALARPANVSASSQQRFQEAPTVQEKQIPLPMPQQVAKQTASASTAADVTIPVPFEPSPPEVVQKAIPQMQNRPLRLAQEQPAALVRLDLHGRPVARQAETVSRETLVPETKVNAPSPDEAPQQSVPLSPTTLGDGDPIAMLQATEDRDAEATVPRPLARADALAPTSLASPSIENSVPIPRATPTDRKRTEAVSKKSDVPLPKMIDMPEVARNSGKHVVATPGDQLGRKQMMTLGGGDADGLAQASRGGGGKGWSQGSALQGSMRQDGAGDGLAGSDELLGAGSDREALSRTPEVSTGSRNAPALVGDPNILNVAEGIVDGGGGEAVTPSRPVTDSPRFEVGQLGSVGSHRGTGRTFVPKMNTTTLPAAVKPAPVRITLQPVESLARPSVASTDAITDGVAADSTGLVIQVGEAVLGHGVKDDSPAWLSSLREMIAQGVALQSKQVRVDSASLGECQILWIRGLGAFAWQADEIAALRRFLSAGGSIYVSGEGDGFDKAFRREIVRLMPSPLRKVAADGAVRSQVYPLAGHPTRLEEIDLQGVSRLLYLPKQKMSAVRIRQFGVNCAAYLLGAKMTQDLAADQQAHAGGIIAWQNFEGLAAESLVWTPAAWGDPATLSLAPDGAGGQALRVDIDAGTQEKTSIEYPVPSHENYVLDLQQYTDFSLDVFHAGSDSISISVVFTCLQPDQTWAVFESKPISLLNGWNRNLTFSLDAKNFRSTISGWRTFDTALSSRNTCGKVTLFFYQSSRAPNTVLVDNLMWDKDLTDH